MSEHTGKCECGSCLKAENAALHAKAFQLYTMLDRLVEIIKDDYDEEHPLIVECNDILISCCVDALDGEKEGEKR